MTAVAPRPPHLDRVRVTRIKFGLPWLNARGAQVTLTAQLEPMLDPAEQNSRVKRNAIHTMPRELSIAARPEAQRVPLRAPKETASWALARAPQGGQYSDGPRVSRTMQYAACPAVRASIASG